MVVLKKRAVEISVREIRAVSRLHDTIFIVFHHQSKIEYLLMVLSNQKRQVSGT